MARAPVSKTGGWGFESLHSCQLPRRGPQSTLAINARRPLGNVAARRVIAAGCGFALVAR
jgi:hypothetical protein